MKKILSSILMVAAVGMISAQAQNDCTDSVQAVKDAIAADKDNVLKIVASETEVNPDCACEIVKQAIVSSKASKITVGEIVKSAAGAAPDRLDLIVQCATAAAPDASANIQAAAASVRGGLTTTGSNPLDFPGDGTEPVGPQPGTDGGNSILRPGPQLDNPPAIDAPVITEPSPPTTTTSNT
ncbi:hypothetical protein HZ994_12690 [Akkermansiaceae bacterium]|nr:hypothetical protein HZ994_12690 [Akkermansiaceae bacterium]